MPSLQYENAMKQMNEEYPNKKLVFQLLSEAHESGDSFATYALATWYLYGEYVEKDQLKAIEFLMAASDNNMPDALYDLAVCYEQGEGVDANSKNAFTLYLKATLWGDEQSVYEIGRCYYYGIGVQEDKTLAEIWLEKAESLGLTDSLDDIDV